MAAIIAIYRRECLKNILMVRYRIRSILALVSFPPAPLTAKASRFSSGSSCDKNVVRFMRTTPLARRDRRVFTARDDTVVFDIQLACGSKSLALQLEPENGIIMQKSA